MDAIEHFAVDHGVTDKGLILLQGVRHSEPARRVRASGRRGNKAIRYPSKKMGCVIQAESQSLEYASILMKEFDSTVREYWDQPPGLPLSYQSGRRQVRNKPTLDFFVIGEDFIGYEEWKPAAELSKIAKKRPDHFCFDDNLGRFISPAIERALEDTGLQYRICTENDLSPILIENLNFLNGYQVHQPDEQQQLMIDKAVELVSGNRSMLIKELIAEVGNGDVVYYALVTHALYFPLDKTYLIDSRNARVFINEAAWVDFNAVTGATIETKTAANYDKLSPKLRYAGAEEMEKAAFRLSVIDDFESRRLSRAEALEKLGIAERTLRRWRADLRGAKDRTQKLEILLQQHAKKGNTASRLSDEVEAIIDEQIEKHYLAAKAISRHALCLRIQNECEENGLPPPANETIYRYVSKLQPEWVAYKTRGAKAAYQETANKFVGLADEPLLGATRYLQYCHIDHTQADLETVNDHGEPLGKPWITTIVDEYSGVILSSYLSYQSPSYVSVMMAIRFMVKRYGKLPETIVVDGGKEFQGHSFEVFAATFGIAIKSREGQPRGGGVVERNFGTINTSFLHNLEGNTKFMKDVRSVSRTHKPVLSATWTLSEMAALLESAFDAFNAKTAKDGNLSPLAMAESSVRRYGERDYLNQPYDDNFIFSSLPFIPRQQATLRRGKTIKAMGQEYWHHSFAQAPNDRIKVDVKWDPSDVTSVYAFYKGCWVQCKISKRFNRPISADRIERSEELLRETQINREAKKAGYKALSKTLVEQESQQAESRKQRQQARENELDLELECVEVVEVTDEDMDFWGVEIPSFKEK